jgi:GT2 family glycosyltransferase
MTKQKESFVTLSIIIISYNTRDELARCVNSIFENTHEISFEVIVVDNNSQDGSPDMIEKEHPEIRLIKNQDNFGFARANNQAIDISQGHYIFMLNSDTLVPPLSISRMVNFLDGNSNAGVVGAKMLNPDYTLQRTARRFPTPMAFFFGRKTLLTKIFPKNKYSRKYLMLETDYCEEPYEVDWVSGGALMVKKEAINQVGVLDEIFFMYWEDAEFCFRMKEWGWKVFCLPSAPIIHYEGRSSNNEKLKLIMYFNKGAYLFYRKHYIKSRYSIMNFVAIIGLTARVLFLSFITILDLTRHKSEQLDN